MSNEHEFKVGHKVVCTDDNHAYEGIKAGQVYTVIGVQSECGPNCDSLFLEGVDYYHCSGRFEPVGNTDEQRIAELEAQVEQLKEDVEKLRLRAASAVTGKQRSDVAFEQVIARLHDSRDEIKQLTKERDEASDEVGAENEADNLQHVGPNATTEVSQNRNGNLLPGMSVRQKTIANFGFASPTEVLELRREKDEEIRELREKVKDQEQEIARHHKDFAAWEAMADKGARQIEGNRRLTAENEELRKANDDMRLTIDDRNRVIAETVGDCNAWSGKCADAERELSSLHSRIEGAIQEVTNVRVAHLGIYNSSEETINRQFMANSVIAVCDIVLEALSPSQPEKTPEEVMTSAWVAADEKAYSDDNEIFFAPLARIAETALRERGMLKEGE